MEINKIEAVIFTVEELKEKKKRVEKKKTSVFLIIYEETTRDTSVYQATLYIKTLINPCWFLSRSVTTGHSTEHTSASSWSLGKEKKKISFQGNAAPRFPLINKRHKAVREERHDRVAWSDEINTSKKKKRKKF